MVQKLLKRKSEGFTLIEIVLVLALAALIVVIVFLAFTGARNSQQDNARRDWVNRLVAACESYASDQLSGNTGQCRNNAPAIQAAAAPAPNIGNTALTAQGSSGVSPTVAEIDVGNIHITLSGGSDYSKQL